MDNKEYELIEEYDIKNLNEKILEIKLFGINNITNMSCMFSCCKSLLLLPDISKWNTSKVTDISSLFSCCKLSSLPDISKWNTSVNHYYLYLFFQNGILIILLV